MRYTYRGFVLGDGGAERTPSTTCATGKITPLVQAGIVVVATLFKGSYNLYCHTTQRHDAFFITTYNRASKIETALRDHARGGEPVARRPAFSGLGN